ncbi:Transcriptional antiterminator of lichenan operon, BglG family [Caldisalinibacter kiritimatiensis]|uniref:Transcriptional antiterminator of lichenan operon, BglG family n=2 Tax=Caldisalinibacter kiritimatiensis TaxID=1304284 RepID=R1CSA5_9FIRM|nr:Transcriptional antiterminator of lichenan operon, BglG family [Caldisalinibacter kiritimatiensis]
MLKRYLEENKSDVPVLPEDRVFYIIRKLLNTNEFITLEELASDLYVSKSTIDKDIDKVEKWLNKYNLKLVKKPNYGIWVEGNELQLRFSISDYFMDIKNRDSNSTCDTEYIKNILAIDIEEIKDIILEVYKDAPIKLSDIAFGNLVIHIAIAIKRIKENKKISLPSTEIKNLKSKNEYKIAEKIVEGLEKVFDINIPEAEKGYITIHLLGTKALRDEELDNHELEAAIGEGLLGLIQRMIQEVNKVYKIDLSKDEKLVYGLALHLKPALNRLKYKMNLRNPLLKEIKEEYPHAFEMAVIACKVLEQDRKVKIDENEIGYIAMHLGAALERKKYIEKKLIRKVSIICATGIGTAQLLASKIKKTFPDIEIAGIYPSYKIDEVLLKKPDLILTTVPVDIDEIPVIHVSSLLNKEDLERINNVIENSQVVNPKCKLYDLFDRDLYIKGIKTKDKYEVIEVLSEALYNKKCVKESFIESAIEREKISSTSIGNLVAIPHALLGNAINSRIAVGILDKPIQWGENMVQLVFLLALEEMTDKEFENIFDTFFTIVDDRRKILDLIKADCFEEFIRFLKTE